MYVNFIKLCFFKLKKIVQKHGNHYTSEIKACKFLL